MTSRRRIPVFELGVVPYAPIQSIQAALREAVAEGSIQGVLLLLEHDAVVTLGNRGSAADLLAPGPFIAPDTGTGEQASEPAESGSISPFPLPIERSERGGAATLHAPGQLVSYPVVPLPGRDLRRFVHGLEQTLIELLGGFGIMADRRPGAPGLYVRGRKIASVGLRCQRWVASHGTSLNVSNDLRLFDSIVSCGDRALEQTSIESECGGSAPRMEEVMRAYVEAFPSILPFDLDVLTGEHRRQRASDLGIPSAMLRAEAHQPRIRPASVDPGERDPA